MAVLLLLTATHGVRAADPETDAAPAAPAVTTEPATDSQPPARSASQEVHEGNRLLLDGLANEALEAYQRAGQQRPDAPEIPFVKGLAHFALEEYEPAREEFLKASSADDSTLADDALYGLGACDHAEALKLSEQPEQAIERLESAMQRYKSVLADRPDHQAARDAIYKAGSLRRQLKQQMEEQQQQQQSDDKDNEDDENESDEQQEKSDGEQSDEEKEQQQDQSEQDQEEQDQENQQQSESDDQQQEQEQQESESQEQSEAEQREQNSREQADRQLREMMQSMRERQRDRKKPQKLIPISPVEKDW